MGKGLPYIIYIIIIIINDYNYSNYILLRSLQPKFNPFINGVGKKHKKHAISALRPREGPNETVADRVESLIDLPGKHLTSWLALTDLSPLVSVTLACMPVYIT